MSDIALDRVTGDIDLATGDLVVIGGVAAVVQHLKIRLQFFLGEWMLDQRIGVPYYQQILIKNPKTSVVRGIFRRTILETPGIVSVNDLQVEYSAIDRTLSVSFSAVTDGGEDVTFEERFVL